MSTLVRYKHYTSPDWSKDECKTEEDLRSLINQLEFYGCEYHIDEPQEQTGMRLIYK